MTCDRLMRCGRDETELSPRIMVDGELKYYDPVQANEILWNEDRRYPNLEMDMR